MKYLVRQGGELSDSFKSLVGLLTGDTASPTLWNIFFADMDTFIAEDPDDIFLGGTRISHLEQADDVVLFSTSLNGLQRKLDQFFAWCGRNFMTISVQKTKWMVFGPAPKEPWLWVNGELLELVDAYKYVGITFTSTTRDLFHIHYGKKAAKARSVACVTFTLHGFIGDLSPADGRHLYTARVDPHLTWGCEVALDIQQASYDQLCDIQHAFLRRLLGVSSRSMLAPLFTETGLTPIRYRRIELALRALKYILELPDSHYVRSALRDSYALLQHGSSGWCADLIWVLAHLPSPVRANHRAISSVEGVDMLLQRLGESLQTWMYTEVHASQRLRLLHDRTVLADGVPTFQISKMQQYLRVPNATHRKSLARLALSCHDLAIERLRYAARRRASVPMEDRICRFCRGAVEDEVHACLQCTHGPLAALRSTFWHDIGAIEPALLWNARFDDMSILRMLLRSENQAVVNRLARYVHEVLMLFAETAMVLQ